MSTECNTTHSHLSSCVLMICPSSHGLEPSIVMEGLSAQHALAAQSHICAADCQRQGHDEFVLTLTGRYGRNLKEVPRQLCFAWKTIMLCLEDHEADDSLCLQMELG